MGTPQSGLADITDVKFTAAAETGGNLIDVLVELLFGASDLDARHVVLYYLSSDANGDTLATDPGTMAVGTNGTLLYEPVDDLVHVAVSEPDGKLNVAITHAGTSGFYLNVVLPSGRVVTSPIIQFA